MNHSISPCLALAFVFASSCSDEPTTPQAPPSQQQPGRPSPVQPMVPDAGTPAVKILQGVVELTLAGLADADAAQDLQKSFEWVGDVARATVDHKAGKARILLRANVRRENVSDALDDLRRRVSEPVKITGFSYEFHESGSAALRW